MADSRHRHAAPRTRRRTRVLPKRVILPAIGLLTLGTAGAAAIAYEGPIDAPATTSVAAAAPQKDVLAASVSDGVAPPTVSRSAERPPVPNETAAEQAVEGLRYAVTGLDVHTDAKASSPVLAEVASGDTVDITGKISGPWTEVMHKGLPRWVRSSEIAKVMPLGTAPCATGSGVESGLQPDTIKVHRAACFAFPSVARYGGVGGGGEHRTGRALDIMVSVGDPIGYQIADFMRANAAKLGISQVIWHQQIWTAQRSGDGWRPMSSRGSATANHLDHVHVTTFGSSATG